MMTTSVTLKRFDGPVQDVSSLASTDLARQSALQTSLVDDAKPDLDPVPIQPSAEQEKALELQHSLEQKQRKLSDILQSLSTELDSAKTNLASRMGDVIADSTLALLPTLVDNGFAQEFSAAVIQIANAIEQDQVTLKVHPNDHELVIDALQSRAPRHPITLEKDISMTSGRVQLSWPDGGAEIDKVALLNHAKSLLETRIASIVSGKN